MSAPLRGIVAYPITPFTEAGRVYERLLAKLVDDMLAAGVHALAPLGSTGVLRTCRTTSARPSPRPW